MWYWTYNSIGKIQFPWKSHGNINFKNIFIYVKRVSRYGTSDYFKTIMGLFPWYFSILKLQTFAISYEIAIYGELGRAHFEGWNHETAWYSTVLKQRSVTRGSQKSKWGRFDQWFAILSYYENHRTILSILQKLKILGASGLKFIAITRILRNCQIDNFPN